MERRENGMAEDVDEDEESIRVEALKQRLKWDDELNLAEDAKLEILAATPILWSSWECDYTAVLYRILPDGEPQLYVEGGVHVSSGNLLETLENRIGAYDRAIARTRAFIATAKGLPPPEPEREWRWVCTVCKTEGKGGEPKACPTCGTTDAWYCWNTTSDDTVSGRERMRRLAARLKGQPDA
jgi:hypothetical protein